jgi:hypothetical protein
MNNWFTVKVKYTKQLENGTFKRVSEPYLLSAMTFTDAEARIYEELGAIIRGEFDVVSISRTELHDIFAYDDASTWWKCKVTYESAEHDSEKVKKVAQTFLVSADTAKEAYERIQESLSTLMVEFNIPSIIFSPIVDIFPPNENLDREISRRPAEDFELEQKSPGKGVVFTASGSDVDEEIEEEEADEIDSEIEDEYADEE